MLLAVHGDGAVDDERAVFHRAGIDVGDGHAQTAEHDGNVRQNTDAVDAGNEEVGVVDLLLRLIPIGVEPAVGLGGFFDIDRHVAAVARMNGDAVPAGDKADDLIAGQRVAALGKLDQTVVDAFHHDALAAFDAALCHHGGRFRPGGFAHHAVIIVLDARHDLAQQNAAVADRGVKIIHRIAALTFGDLIDKFVVLLLGQMDARAAHFTVELVFALDDVLLAPLFLEPASDLAARLARAHDVEPIAARSLARLRRGDDIDDLAVFHLIVDRHDAPVDLGADHAVADRRVDSIGKIDDRRAAGQINNVALGGEHIDFLAAQVVFDGRDDLIHADGVVLAFEHLTDPREPVVIIALAALGHVELIFPVRRDTVFRRVVHIPRADLHLEGDALFADDGRVQRLIHIGFRGGNIILEPPGQRTEQIVHHAQTVVAVDHGVNDDAHGVNIIDFIERSRLALHEHFAVDAVNALDSAVDLGFDAALVNALDDALADIGQKLVALSALAGELFFNFMVTDRIQKADGEILQFLLHRTNTQTVRDGRVDFNGFQRLVALLLFRHEAQGAHIVQAIRQLDDDHADIVRHGDEHFAQIFRLLLFFGAQLDLAQLGHAVDQRSDVFAELFFDLFNGDGRILRHVVQHRRRERFGVHAHVSQNDRHGDRMDDVGLTRPPGLIPVSLLGDLIGAVDHGNALFGIVALHQHFQFLITAVGFVHCHIHAVSPPLRICANRADVFRSALLVCSGKTRRPLSSRRSVPNSSITSTDTATLA